MNTNDRSLLKQMIVAGRFNYGIYQLLIESNKQKTQEMIKAMGTKWCLHPDNAVKKLDVPLPLLSEPRQSRVLRKSK